MSLLRKFLMSTLKDKLVDSHGKPSANRPSNRVTVVGAGAVGMACAFSILTQRVSNDVVLIDVNENLVKGELMDLQHGRSFLDNAHIRGGSDYSLTEGSHVCVVTAGARQKEGESRLNLVQRNAEIMRGVIPELVRYSPDAIIMMVTNPVDVMSYVAWRLSGLPQEKVFGAGTNLDTARFQVMLSTKLGVSPKSCHGYVIGEHGDSSIPVWSNLNVAGVRLRDLKRDIATPSDDEKFGDVHKEVVNAAYEIIKLKGYTSWAIGLSVTQLVSSILGDSEDVHTVSVNVKGQHGVEDDVFLSLPAILEAGGVTGIIKHSLDEEEERQFQRSAALLKEVADQLKL